MRKHLLLSFVLVLCGCSGPGETLNQSENAIKKFHAMYNKSQYDKIRDRSADEYKAIATPTMNFRVMKTFKKKLGKWKSGKRQSWRLNYVTGGSNMVLVYKSKFAKGSAVETFTFKQSDGEAKLTGYFVNSPLLMIELEPED